MDKCRQLNLNCTEHEGRIIFQLYIYNSWAANRLKNYYIDVVCCLSVCVSDRDDFKWHNIVNSKYIAMQLYMRVYTPDHVSCYWNLTLSTQTIVFAAKRHSVYPKNCSLKCNISMNNFLNRRIHMFGEYGTYGKIRAIKGKFDQIGVIKSK